MPLQEAHLAASGMAVPYAINNEQLLSVHARIRQSLGQSESIANKFEKFVRATGIQTRHFVHPIWLDGDQPDQVPAGAMTRDLFTPSRFRPSFQERMAIFDETSVPLGVAAAHRALQNWEGDRGEITHIITTCTSGWSHPGMAVPIIQSLDLRHDCAKAELNFNGCFCGATCLRLARDIIRSGESTGVLVVAAETSSTHFDPLACDTESLIAASLFADGAAAMIVAPDGPWRIENAGMSLVPNSEKLLRLSPPVSEEHCSYRMHLDKSVGAQLHEYFAKGKGRAIVDRVCPGTTDEDFPALGIHPGGPRILDGVKQAFVARGWQEHTLDRSYRTLQKYGNLGSAAMLFVLTENLPAIEEKELLTMAFGPGVTVEWAKLCQT